MPHLPSLSIRRRMSGRDTAEPHRASSSLELLFDLTFVVAIAQVAVQLAHSITEGEAATGLLPYVMVFFAIWWAWMNFTWFASAYDTDDVFYRLLTLVQMVGVLVIAAGVPEVFTHENFAAVTLGYLIMRVGLVAQWIRAGIENPAGRATAFRYAAGIVVVQAGWVLRLLLPAELGLVSFVVLAVLDVSVPPWTERAGKTPWHPHHIAERYGLFTIILLGESVAATTIAVQGVIEASGVSSQLITVALGGLVLLVALWWIYFLDPAGEALSRLRSQSFLWGYGHYILFASVAAIGAGLEVAVDVGTHHSEISPVIASYAVTIPVAVFFVSLVLLWLPLERHVTSTPAAVVAAVVVLLLPLAAPVVGVAAVVAFTALVAAALVAFSLALRVPQA